MGKYFIVSLVFIADFISAPAQVKQRPPNIIVILADDLGWADLSSYGSTFYETPNLDQLADRGIRFTQHYTTSPVCSPTRASLMTGKYPVKTGVTDWIPGRQENGKARPWEKLISPPTANQLALGETTISELALDYGYKTFFAGKWHLGEDEKFWPLSHGFQVNKGGWKAGAPTGKINDSTGGFFTPYKNPVLPDGPAGEYLSDRLTNECISFIESNRDQPFFIVHSLYAVHNPMQAPAALVKKYEAKQKQGTNNPASRFVKDEPWMNNEAGWKQRAFQDNPVYAAMIENMDWNIGRLLAKLKEMNLDENTLLVFTSDNGGLSTAEGSPTTNGPLRGGKGWLYEGGIRVPLILYWKGKVQAGSVSGLPCTTADIFPTLAAAMHSSYRKNRDIDGEDILKMLNREGRFRNRTLYWYYPHYSNQGGKPGSAIREGNFKLVYSYETRAAELYDLSADPGERSNLAAGNPRIVERLQKKLLRWIKQSANPVFTPNPLMPPAETGKAPLP